MQNRQVAELAFARVKATGNWKPDSDEENTAGMTVAEICSAYITHMNGRAVNGSAHPEYSESISRFLNDLCGYCGTLSVQELRKGHIEHWVESHASWKSPVTRRGAITTVISAFNYACEMHGIRNPLTGLKKPPQRPKLQSFSLEDEQLLYSATDECFGNFLFAAIHTGLRPFCELAKLTSDHVIETDRGMMWRVYSSKTKKTRKIPIRAEVAELVRELIAASPGEAKVAIFRNTKQRPWQKVTGVGRFLRIKKDLGWSGDSKRKRYSTYTCRHTFAHRMLAGYWNEDQGCSIEVLAELIGDTPKVAFDHYGKEWGQHYQEPLWAAMGIS